MYKNKSVLGNEPRQQIGAMRANEIEGGVGETTTCAFVPGIEMGPKRPKSRKRDSPGQNTSGGI